MCKLILLVQAEYLNGKSNLQKVSCQTVTCLKLIICALGIPLLYRCGWQPEAEFPERELVRKLTQVLTELKGGMDWFCWAERGKRGEKGRRRRGRREGGGGEKGRGGGGGLRKERKAQ